MSNVSRRSFIAGTGAAVAAAGAAGLMTGTAAADETSDAADGIDEPIVARVRNVASGEVSLYVGTEEITYTDRVLARRLARAARHAD